MLVLGFYRLRYTLVLGIQLIAIGLNHLGRQNIHTHIPCLGILVLHYEIFLKLAVFIEIFFKQIWCNQKGEKIALFLHHFHGLLYIFSPAFTGSKKLIVPYRYISATGDVMYNSHQLVCIVTVFFAIA